MAFNKIIFIVGGSFQGKSLISLKLASKFNFSGVVTTDMIRNILFIQNPNKKYLGTSTYLLDKQSLERQKEEVSNILKDIFKKYMKEEEKKSFLKVCTFQIVFLKAYLKGLF